MNTPRAPRITRGTLIASKYRLSKRLGAGGTATVWLATNEVTGAEVALKIVRPAGRAADMRARVVNEAQISSRLAHRGIVRVYDLVELPDAAGVAIVMERLWGHTLAEHLADRGRLSAQEAVGIFLPVLGALAYAHDAGVVHRDVKPDNIFLAVEPDGIVTPKLLDFGFSRQRRLRLAPMAGDGKVSGTPCFMSPEQVQGAPDVDERSDVFSAGVVLYELLSGKNPFERSGVEATARAVLESEPAPIGGAPEALGNVLRRAMEKSRSARFPSAAAFAAALRGAIGVAGTPSWPGVLLHPTPPLAARRAQRGAHPAMRVGAMVLAAVGITLAMASTDLFHLAKGATAGRTRARPAPVRQCETEAALARSHVDSQVTPRSSATVSGARLPAIARDPGF